MAENRLFLTASQLRMARAASRCSADQVATLAGISPNTVRRLEKELERGGVTTGLLERLQRVYENLGVHFEPDDGVHGPGVRAHTNGSATR